MFFEIIISVNDHIRYTRGCLTDDLSIQQLDEATIDVCSSDGCNSARNHMPFILMILTAPIIIGIYNLLMQSSRRSSLK